MKVKDSATGAKLGLLLPPGAGWGALGVLAFSLTFPASRAALPVFGPVTVPAGVDGFPAASATLSMRGQTYAKHPRMRGPRVRLAKHVARGASRRLVVICDGGVAWQCGSPAAVLAGHCKLSM